ncbi:MAG TPA: hypothetical protein VFA20_13690 [Myxococcaceae bacterium]|nr:hypothetical protein [Myxococcaceae bacterium]
MIEANLEWRRFIARAGKTHYRDEIGIGARPGPLRLQIGPRKPRRLLYFTKRSLPEVWSGATELPGDLAIFWESWFSSRQSCDLLIRYTREVGRPFFFVGDLTPIGLTRFADLRSRGVPVRYLGIDDRWLQLCRQYWRPFGTLKSWHSIILQLDDTGLEHLALVNRLLPDLERLIGPECFALLQSGQSLQLEGAGLPHHFRKPFLPALTHLLLGSSKSLK